MCICIGYMPVLQVSSKDLNSPAGRHAYHELYQSCARAIIDVIEKCGEYGFKCTLDDVTWCLFPILAKMEFDGKERYKFFACSKEHACPIGSGPRQGHSTLRRCTPHSSRKDLPRKRKIAMGNSAAADEASRSLKRLGVHPSHECTALKSLRHTVLHWPGRIHFGLANFDIMHNLYINYITYLQEALLSTLTPTLKQELDRRVCSFTSFIKPHDGSCVRKVHSLTKISYMSAEMRVLHLFVWSHAIGSQAGIFPENLRPHVLKAVCSLQVMCYSTREKRPYTEAEHRWVTILRNTCITGHTSQWIHGRTYITGHTSQCIHVTTYMTGHTYQCRAMYVLLCMSFHVCLPYTPTYKVHF